MCATRRHTQRLSNIHYTQAEKYIKFIFFSIFLHFLYFFFFFPILSFFYTLQGEGGEMAMEGE